MRWPAEAKQDKQTVPSTLCWGPVFPRRKMYTVLSPWVLCHHLHFLKMWGTGSHIFVQFENSWVNKNSYDYVPELGNSIQYRKLIYRPASISVETFLCIDFLWISFKLLLLLNCATKNLDSIDLLETKDRQVNFLFITCYFGLY